MAKPSVHKGSVESVPKMGHFLQAMPMKNVPFLGRFRCLRGFAGG